VKESSINITIYDISGAPLSPEIVRDFEKLAEELAKKEKGLALNVSREA
jgi:hypothetical protein